MTKSNGSRADPPVRQLVQEVAAVYAWLDHRMCQVVRPAGTCKHCGRCCDFEAFGHRLFITTPEWIAFRRMLGEQPVLAMPTGRCPYNQQGLCTVYAIRFSGCRIFGCRADQQAQSELTESVMPKFKALCEQYALPYLYGDLAAALNGQWTDIGL